LSVPCDKPDKGQRMHLLVLSIREPDGVVLETDMEKALQCQQDKDGVLQAPAFKPVIPYGPLVGYNVRRENLNHQLYTITTNIKRLAQAGSFGNDVVMLYYQGGEALTEDGHFFRTDLTQKGAELKASAIDCQELVDFFADTPGAHVLLLDVDRRKASAQGANAPRSGAERARDRVAQWATYFKEAQAHVVVLRYSWLGAPAVPKDARLIAALQESMPHASRLVQVLESAGQFADNLKKDYPNLLLYDKHPSPDLNELLVGAAAPGR
jgi:hypothetical protein